MLTSTITVGYQDGVSFCIKGTVETNIIENCFVTPVPANGPGYNYDFITQDADTHLFFGRFKNVNERRTLAKLLHDTLQPLGINKMRHCAVSIFEKGGKRNEWKVSIAVDGYGHLGFLWEPV